MGMIKIGLGVVAVMAVAGGIISGGGHDGDPKANADGSSGSSSESSSKADSSDRVGDKYGAEVACEEFVKRMLKSPSSAHFSSEAPKRMSGATWWVIGQVDADNSFGAPIRQRYICKTKFKGDDNWLPLEAPRFF